MRFQEPKDTEAIVWTKHAREKMRYYCLSSQRIKGILRYPERIEEGVAPRTIAAMKPGRTKRPSEIWLMYQKNVKGQRSNLKTKKQEQIVIISAWRYPGISPVGQPPIPAEVLELINNQ